MCSHGVFHARGQRHLPHGIILAAGQGCRTRPGHAPHHLRQQPGETQLLATYSRKRWRGAYGTAAARNVKFIITELRDRFIGINRVPPKRRSTSARRVGAYYDARSSEWFG